MGGDPLDVRTDAAVVGGRPQAVGLVEDGRGSAIALLYAEAAPGDPAAADAAPKLRAYALAPRTPDGGPLLLRSGFAYLGPKELGLVTLYVDRVNERASGAFVSLATLITGRRAVHPLPTLADLGERPIACTPAQRTGTPRFEVPLYANSERLFEGQRRPVLVTERAVATGSAPSSALWLLTRGAVLHGTPEAPCVAGWEAVGTEHAPFAALIGGDLRHAWLFRKPTGEQPGRSVEARPMSCRYDSGGALPPHLWHEPGATRIGAPKRP